MHRARLRLILMGLLTLITLIGIAMSNWKREPVAKAPEKLTAPIAGGDLRNRAAVYQVVFYFTPDPKVPPESTARELVASLLPDVTFGAPSGESPAGPAVSYEEESVPLISYPVPDKEYFKFAGRGLSDEDISAVKKTSRAVAIQLRSPADQVWKYSRAWTQFAYKFAEMTGAFLWDEATRECFSQDAWRERRLDSWPEDHAIPHITRHITIHLYQADPDSPWLRAITLGMVKFGLPDVVIERLTRSDSRTAGSLLIFVCQRLADSPHVASGGIEKFSLDQLQSPEVREKLMESMMENGRGEITLALLPAQAKDGDPENRIIELDFRMSPGATESERRNVAQSQMWGSKDAIKDVQHDDELLAASKRAQAKLPEVRRTFVEAKELGSRLLLKAPFKQDGEGNEWMWVEVQEWPEQGEISGILQNDPFYIAALKAGAPVKISASDVFDYILYHSDGTSEGNETGKLIELQSGQERSK